MEKKIETYTKIKPTADIKIEPFDVKKRYTEPHRHNKYLELVYFRKGSGVHYMDQTEYAIEPPVVFIIKKDEVHHWAIDSVPDGYVIIIKEDFLDGTLDKKINHQLIQLTSWQRIQIDPDRTIDHLFAILGTEIRRDGPRQNEVVEGALKALLGKILGYTNTPYTVNTTDRTLLFKDLLDTGPKNDVSYYATLLNTSPQNLNALCKREYGKTASRVIATHIVKEAKRLLRFTDLSVTEIAYTFDFTDVSHFVKYFKRHEGATPMQFKKGQ